MKIKTPDHRMVEILASQRADLMSVLADFLAAEREFVDALVSSKDIPNRPWSKIDIAYQGARQTAIRTLVKIRNEMEADRAFDNWEDVKASATRAYKE
jgi:hypothetical protein